jgi:uncharacterized protein (TIGR00255 family)
MNSMTGFGSATRRDRDFDIEVEVRSVNHRFFSFRTTLPEVLARHEGEIDALVRDRIGRGSVNLTVSVKAAETAEPALPDLRRIKAYHRRLREMQKTLGIAGEVSLRDLLLVPSLWSDSSSASAPADLWPRTRKLVVAALEALVAMRAREGATIARDMRTRLDSIESAVGKIEGRVPAVVQAYQKRLDERMQAILAQKGMEVSRADLVKEIALHAERCDVSEELQRLRAHVAEFGKLTRARGQIGRRLDFLSQEMVRETNTLASKGSDSEISSCAVAVKAELERIKEQVENVE